MIGRPVEQLSPNAVGRDLLVSDLHGMRAQLMDALERVGFDVQHDRLICVGDLVDKGPDSLGTLRLLDEPWFFAVLGNHDLAAALWLLHEAPLLSTVEFECYRLPMEPWLKGLDSEERREVARHLGSLPWLLELPIDDQIVGVVHAEVPEWECTWEGLRARVHAAFEQDADMEVLAPLVQGRRYRKALTDGSARALDAPEAVVPDVRAVVHGHTINPHTGFRPWRVGNRIHIDSGAFLAQPAWSAYWPQFTVGWPGITLVDACDPMTPL